MKKLLLLLGAFLFSQILFSQRINPAIPSFGGIYEIPESTENPDPKLKYNIVVDITTGTDKPRQVLWPLTNLSRMLNLHMAGGLKKENMNVIAVIHSSATNSILNNAAFNESFKLDNPNTSIIKELHDFGVKFFVCGQSLKSRDILPRDVLDEVQISISALTVLTTYQLKGYAKLEF